MPANPFSGLFGAPAPSAARNPFSGLFGGAGPLDEEETLSERLERERLEAEEKTKAEQRRLREEREREMREMGATDAVAPARRANPLDALRRAGVAMTAAVPAVSNIKESAARLLLPAGPIEDAAVRGLTGTERSLARRGEELTGLPLTNEGVARRTDEWRSLEHPGQSPLEEALGDTVLEGVGGMLDVPGPGGAAGLLARRLGRGATAVPAGMLASAERRALPALRAEVDAIMPKLAGKTREELAGLAASAKPGTALSIAARRAMGRADLEDAGVGVGEEFAARPGPRAAAAAPVTPEEAAAKAARFRAALAKKATTGPPPGMVAEEAAPFDVAAGHPTRPTAQKLEPPDVPFEFNARRLNLSEADAGQLLSTIRENMPAIQAQRRAGQGGWDKFSAPDRLAARLGITKERLLKTKAGTTFNDEEFAVLDSTLGGVSERISSISKEIATGAATEAARAELAKLTVEYATLLKVSVGAGSEAGRALGSLRAFKKAMALPDRARMAVLKKYGSLMDDAKVERLATIDNPDDMAAFLRTLDQPKAGELVHEAYISSLVSGLASQERNLLGNSVMALTEQGARTLRRTAAAAGDVIRSRVTGAPRQHFASEATAGWVGMGHGFRRGLSKAAVVFRKGYDPATPLDELVGKFQFGGAFARHPSKAVRALGLVITPPLRALSAVDAFYKTIGFTSEQYALATKAALRSGKRGEELAGAVAEHLNDPDILEAAGKYAAGVTLTDAPSEVTARFLRFRDAPAQSAPAKVARGGIKFIAPFVKIADRLMVKGFEYTPVGAIRGVSQMAKGATTEGADLLARSAIGSTVMLGVAGMAEEGNLTAWAPRDDIEKERFYAAQKQPWSMKIGNRWVPYAQLEPFSTPIAIVAAARQAYEESGELPPADVALHVMQALAQRTLDASYMDSVQSLFESMSSDERAADKLARISSGIATGVAVPYSGAVRSVAQAQDPRYVRP
ncbi:MAG TPA: hypothetical protein VFD06_11650, partial [Candidatus Polarisedimenticolia bacterium]|nr:hypothetical protein [Candidatus Polarisedimenticolia bacterium]